MVCVLAPGVIICIARTVTKIVLPDTGAGLRISTAVYFAFSSVFLLLCVLGCQNLHKLPIMQFYERRKGQSESLLAVDRLPAGDDLKAPTLVGLADGSLQKVDMPPGPIKWLFSKFFTVEGHALALRRSEGADYWKVFLKVWPCATTLWLVYIVTLSIFPGMLQSLTCNSDHCPLGNLFVDFYMTYIYGPPHLCTAMKGTHQHPTKRSVTLFSNKLVEKCVEAPNFDAWVTCWCLSLLFFSCIIHVSDSCRSS